MKILDCTLRDGGYYNNWDFDQNVVDSYLDAIATTGIEFVELGLRNFPKEGFLGAFAYTTEQFLNQLDLPEGPTYGVMVDAKTVLSSEMPIEDAVDALFVDASESKIGLVRVAAHFPEVEKSEKIVKLLKDKGYIVGYNLMQAGGKPDQVLTEKACVAQSWGCLDALYFADSLGNMDGNEVTRIIEALKLGWNGTLGIHTHNNMGKALDNSLIARANGVEWIDVTVTGMGRGAGNAQTENLLAVVAKEGHNNYSPTPVYELAIRHFEPMQKQYGWGSNLLYFIGAQNDIHPTYIQNLLSDTHYGTDEVVGAIEYLSELDNTTSYDGEVFHAALSFNVNDKPVSGSCDLVGKASGLEVLILASGPSLKKYDRHIQAYIKQNNPLVIAINNLEFPPALVDYYCVSHNTKFLSEQENYINISKPVILPEHRFSKKELELFPRDVTLNDIGLEIARDQFLISESMCTVPYDVTVAYALGVSSIMSAEKISLVGFDGFEAHDSRQREMLELWELIKGYEGFPKVVALTPTNYPISQGSIYAPV